MAWALAGGLAAPIHRWAMRPARRAWAWPVIIGLPLAWAVFPFDAGLSEWSRGLGLRGDARRELEALQQFGQGALSAVIALSIWLLDAQRRRRLLDWLAAALLALLTTNLLKCLLGRPRPFLDEPELFVGPMGKHPIPTGDSFVLRSSWEAGYALASMPSRHAAFAAVAGVFLAALYPRLTPVCVGLTLVVAAARVVTGAHYPSDVVLGLAIGLVCARLAVHNLWGVRGLDWLWARTVDREAGPAWPAVVEVESRVLGPRFRRPAGLPQPAQPAETPPSAHPRTGGALNSLP